MLDSLINLYPTIKDEYKQIDIINRIGYLYYTVDIEKTLEYAQLGLKRSEKINYHEGKGTALNTMSIYYDVSGDIDKALALNKEVLHIGEETHNDFLITISCNNIANKYDTKGEPQEAIKYYQRAITISEKNEDAGNLILGFANLAMVFDKLNERKKANFYYLKAKKIQDLHPERAMYCWFYGILGDWYFKISNNDEAKRCYNISLTESKKRNDKRAIVSLNLSLSKLHLTQNKIKLAEQNIRTAIQTSQLIGDRTSTLSAEIGLLELYLNTKQLKNANTLGRNLLDTVQVYKYTAEEMKIYDILSQVHLQKEDYKKGYELNQNYLRLKDSLFAENKRIEVTKIEEKYQSEIKEKENIVLRSQQKEQAVLLKSQQKLGLALIAIIFLTSLIGLLIYRAYKDQRNSSKELEQKVIERTKALMESNSALKKSNEELERFAYIASHDLREPLRNISGFTKLLQRELPDKLSPTANEYLTFIIKSTKQMHTLIEGVLDYSRVTKNDDELIDVDFNSILSNIKETLILTLEKKQGNIIIENSLCKKIANPSKIYFLFKNLIENGLKYNQSTLPEVRIGCNKIDNQTVYYVSDNGIGIEEAYKEKVFEMFKRLNNREKYEGTGLGLSICKKIVEEQGGKIWIDTQQKNGATFYFTLESPKQKENKKPLEHAKIPATSIT